MLHIAEVARSVQYEDDGSLIRGELEELRLAAILVTLQEMAVPSSF